MYDSLLKRSEDLILQHIDLLFPVLLPELASPVCKIPAERESKANATYDEKELGFVWQFAAVGRSKSEEAAQGEGNESPEVGCPFPV